MPCSWMWVGVLTQPWCLYRSFHRLLRVSLWLSLVRLRRLAQETSFLLWKSSMR